MKTDKKQAMGGLNRKIKPARVQCHRALAARSVRKKCSVEFRSEDKMPWDTIHERPSEIAMQKALMLVDATANHFISWYAKTAQLPRTSLEEKTWSSNTERTMIDCACQVIKWLLSLVCGVDGICPDLVSLGMLLPDQTVIWRHFQIHMHRVSNGGCGR